LRLARDRPLTPTLSPTGERGTKLLSGVFCIEVAGRASVCRREG
jgi:hypothetical protein